MKNKYLNNLEYMKCKRCSKQRIKTKSGVCLICEPKTIHGIEKESPWYRYKQGIEVISKTGKDDNIWMSRK